MSESAAARFSCTGCGKTYAWKAELAGKRAKCKCGTVMTVPQSAAAPEEDALYDLAPAEEAPKPKHVRAPAMAVAEPTASVRTGGAASLRAPAMRPATAAPVGYRPAPVPAKKDRMTADVLMDRNRDLVVPVVLLVLGFVIYVGYYVWEYEPSGAGIAAITAGVAMMTAFKAALMVGFALVLAGPLGVSFGGPLTATLKLAAVAVFCDGCTTWVDAGVNKVAAGFGGMFISFPVALAIYWMLLTYLFSMDPGDSWMVVILLAVFDMVVRWVLIWVLVSSVLSWGGVSAPAAALGGGGGGAGVTSSSRAMQIQVQEMKDHNQLIEAREFISGGRQASLQPYVDAWYQAGCKNVWFEGSRDINGRFDPGGLVVELPAEKDKRAACYDILNKYYTDMQMGGSDDKDEGDPYLFVGMR